MNWRLHYAKGCVADVEIADRDVIEGDDQARDEYAEYVYQRIKSARPDEMCGRLVRAVVVPAKTGR